jgi:hypothetical protein
MLKKRKSNLANVEELAHQLNPLILEINQHPLYHQIYSTEHLRKFMEQHVFAVWDFMCLLKELQRRIVCTGAPWCPPVDGLSAHLISSILVEEESDIDENGSYTSHF